MVRSSTVQRPFLVAMGHFYQSVCPCHWACNSIAVFGDGWWAFSRHGQILKASLPKLFLHWRHPCSLQDVSVPNLVPQGDPQDVTKATHLKRLQLTDVMLGHSPCLCFIEEHRQHQSSKVAYFSGNTEGSTAKHFLSPNMVHCPPSLVLLTLLVQHW